MGDIVQSASAILSSAQRRSEVAANNIANIATPGFRGRQSFSEIVSSGPGATSGVRDITRISTSEGLVSETGNPLDLAVVGEGFFELRGADGPLYTRNGQFHRGPDGLLLGLGDRAVQGVGGGDITLPDGDWTITRDGDVLSGGRTIGRLALAAFPMEQAAAASDGLLRVPAEHTRTVDAPQVRSGFLESANVTLADEMITLMEAVRRAETGQRLMNVYDDLMGRAVTTFGQAGG